MPNAVPFSHEYSRNVSQWRWLKCLLLSIVEYLCKNSTCGFSCCGFFMPQNLSSHHSPSGIHKIRPLEELSHNPYLPGSHLLFRLCEKNGAWSLGAANASTNPGSISPKLNGKVWEDSSHWKCWRITQGAQYFSLSTIFPHPFKCRRSPCLKSPGPIFPSVASQGERKRLFYSKVHTGDFDCAIFREVRDGVGDRRWQCCLSKVPSVQGLWDCAGGHACVQHEPRHLGSHDQRWELLLATANLENRPN